MKTTHRFGRRVLEEPRPPPPEPPPTATSAAVALEIDEGCHHWDVVKSGYGKGSIVALYRGGNNSAVVEPSCKRNGAFAIKGGLGPM